MDLRLLFVSGHSLLDGSIDKAVGRLTALSSVFLNYSLGAFGDTKFNLFEFFLVILFACGQLGLCLSHQNHLTDIINELALLSNRQIQNVGPHI